MDEEIRRPEEEIDETTLPEQVDETMLLDTAAEAPESMNPEPEAAGEQKGKRGASCVAIALVIALAIALGVGAAMCGRSKAPEPEPEPPAVERVEPNQEPEPAEPEELTEGEVEKMLGELEWGGEDVSPAEEDEVEVTLEEGHLMVTVTGKTDPAKAAEWAAKRAAALAEALEGRCEDVTVVSAGEGGKPLAAVTYDAKAPEPAEDLAGLLSQAKGHAIADDAYEAMGDEPGVPQRAGEEPLTPKGDRIVPEPEPDEVTEAEDEAVPEETGEDGEPESAAATDASKSATTPSSQPSGGSGSQPSGNAGSSSSASPSSSGSGTSSGSSSSGGAGERAQTWVPEVGHWATCGTCGGSGTVSQTVLVSGAWDEQVVSGEHIQFSDGYVCYTQAEADAHFDAVGPGVSLSYSVVTDYTTVHHDAVYQNQTVTCSSCGGDGGTYVVDVPGHYE